MDLDDWLLILIFSREYGLTSANERARKASLFACEDGKQLRIRWLIRNPPKNLIKNSSNNPFQSKSGYSLHSIDVIKPQMTSLALSFRTPIFIVFLPSTTSQIGTLAMISTAQLGAKDPRVTRQGRTRCDILPPRGCLSHMITRIDSIF